MIRFHNTLSGKDEEFQPLKAKEVKLYTCGPTVYDYAHIGNFRAFVFEDLLRRFLEFQGYKVNHVMNLTDVDDKTIAGANKEGTAGDPKERLNRFTEKYIQAFNEDLKTLNILPPKKQPRATAEIDPMIDLIKKLVEKKAAYEKDGSVYYRVSEFPSYGKLSKKKLEKNIEGARVDVDEYEKEQGADFVLWKKSKPDEPAWDSPWGAGRPGWHIECSAMSMKYLGKTFDIHAGGEDLIFPHHENEIAQSEAATGKPFVQTWLHCKFLLVDGEKMSKSKGNFYTLRDLLAQGHDPMAIRYALLAVHYRSPLNFTTASLKEASEVIKKMDECYFQCLSLYSLSLGRESSADFKPVIDAHEDRIRTVLGQDLNMSVALAVLLELVGLVNSGIAQKSMDRSALKETLEFFRRMDLLLGLDIATLDAIPGPVLKRLVNLQESRKVKNFQEADKLRDEFKSEGWLVKDGRPGEPSTLKKKQRIWDK